MAEEAFEASRNPSESQRSLPRQQTQNEHKGTDETCSVLQQKTVG